MTREQEDLLDDLLNVESGLSGKSIDFICDLDQAWRERDLTDKQSDYLHSLARQVNLES